MIVKRNKLRMSALFAVLGLLAGCSGAGKTEEKISAALAQAKQGRWEKAGSMAEEISAAAPNAMPPLLLRAVACERNGEFAKALDLARQCAAMERSRSSTGSSVPFRSVNTPQGASPTCSATSATSSRTNKRRSFHTA